MSECATRKWRVAAVWLARVLTGCTFVLSGWAKSVDPYGFFYKIGEYLEVWDIHSVPDELIVIGGVLLAVFELVTGMLLATGCLRRSTPICALGLMCFMLPLTVYITVADPVADCGCFGDLIVLSNSGTLIKNIVLTALLIVALVWGKTARPLFKPEIQWIVIALTTAYGLTLAFIGWNFQPVVDFRPYSVGQPLLADSGESDAPKYIYGKDGVEREFDLNELPDSTWTFIGIAEGISGDDELAIFDGDDEVTEDVLDYNDGDMLVMVVSHPDIAYLTRARMANELYDYAVQRGIRMIALVAAAGDELELWKEYARPRFEVYSASDTSLKQLARGTTALVLVRDGRVAWKRNMAYLDMELTESTDGLDGVWISDDGRVAWCLTLAWIVAIILLWWMQTFMVHSKCKNE